MKVKTQQLDLPFSNLQLTTSSKAPLKSSEKENNNKLDPKDAPFHNWYRFVLSFPPHLVRHYIDEFSLGKSLASVYGCKAGFLKAKDEAN